MKRICLILLSVCMLGGLVMAQKPVKKDAMTPEARAEKMTTRMVKELSLNNKQAAQIKVLNLELVTRMQAKKVDLKLVRQEIVCDSCKKVKKEKKAEMKEMRAGMKEAKEAREAELKTILTPEQYSLYQKNMEQRSQKKDAPRSRK